MDYFFTPPSLIGDRSLSIKGEELRHLSKVLRKKVGDLIYVVDGNECAYKVILKSISRTVAEGDIQETFYRWNESDTEVRLAVAVLKNPSRFDFLVEKCTELGVREIIPMRTERTIPTKIHSDRLQKIALSAMKQSGRSFLPPIHPPMDFPEVLSHLKMCDTKLIAHEKADQGEGVRVRRGVEERVKTGGILVGPEGGFTDEEFQSALAAGFKTLSLGSRRLRSETAAIAAVSLFLV